MSVGGYFQSYALGNILSAQFFDAALKAHPKLKEEFARGEFQNLLNWLKTNIHCHGKRFTTHEILKQSTGQELSVKPFVNYLREKYGKIYGLRQDIK
ncbi:MAG: hypothetical protein EB107_09205 [Proteobacteria bacterium]|nr:hypothetical protein [Pseudomonadota bacterium]